MRVDGFYVVGRETPGDAVAPDYAVFLRTYGAGCALMRHWGGLAYADRYRRFEDAKKAAVSAPPLYTDDGPAAVWRVEVTAEKETR